MTIAAPEKDTSSDSDEVDVEYDDDVKVTSTTSEQPLLFVHQTDW